MSVLVLNDYVYSALAGLLISVAIIKFGSGPAVFNFKDEEEIDLKKDKEDSTQAAIAKEIPSQPKDVDTPSNEELPKINEEYALKKLAPIQNFLGLSDEQMGRAIEDTNEEIVRMRDTSQLDISDNLNGIIDGIVFIVGIAFGCYAINIFTQGDFGRMVAAMFPDEVKSLKLRVQ